MDVPLPWPASELDRISSLYRVVYEKSIADFADVAAQRHHRSRRQDGGGNMGETLSITGEMLATRGDG